EGAGHHERPTLVLVLHHDLTVIVRGLERRVDVDRQRADAAEREALHGASQYPAADDGDHAGAVEPRIAIAPREALAVAPRGELRPQRLPDADEIRAVTQRGEADLLGGHTLLRIAVEALPFLDAFPARLQRREVPLPAAGTHDPETPARLVEGEALPDREVLDGLVATERGVAEGA